MTSKEFCQWATANGWSSDRHGHYHKDENGSRYRFRIQKLTVRLEVQVSHEGGPYTPPSKSWVRLRSGYFTKLSISPNGKIAGLTR